MRPRQWSKNLIVFAPAAFGGVLLTQGVATQLFGALVVLSLASSSVYILNDVRDREADRAYAKTRSRPFASGALGVHAGLGFSAVLAAFALGLALIHSLGFATIVAAYFALQIAYTLWLKHVIVLDVLAIAAGFVLRAVAGARVAGIPDSPWLLACTVFLVLLVALGERRLELRDLGECAWEHRRVLRDYDEATLDILIAAMLGSALVSYVIYTLIAPTAPVGQLMVLTAPFVAYGLMRYVALLRSTEPKTAEDLLLTDVPILIDVALWVVAVFVLVYVV